MFLLCLNIFLLIVGCLMDIFSAIVVVVPVCPLGGAPFPAAVGQLSVPAIGTPWGRTWELGTVPIPSCRCNRSSRTWALWKMKFVAVSWAVVTPCRIRA